MNIKTSFKYFGPLILAVASMCFEVKAMELRADALCWRAKQHGLEYANSPLPVLTTDDFTVGSRRKPNFDWDAGFRIMAGKRFCSRPFFCSLQYTYYKGNSKGHVYAGDDEAIFPLMSISSETFPTDYVERAKIRSTLTTSLLDLALGYDFQCSRCAKLIASISARYASIFQKGHVNYYGGMFNGGVDKVSMRDRFDGIGPRITLRPNFKVSPCFSIYAEASAAALFGHLNVKEDEKYISNPRGSYKKSDNSMRWNFDASTGMEWSWIARKHCCNTRYLLGLGLDYTYFSKQFYFGQGSEFKTHRDLEYLQLYGCHASIGMQF